MITLIKSNPFFLKSLVIHLSIVLFFIILSFYHQNIFNGENQFEKIEINVVEINSPPKLDDLKKVAASPILIKKNEEEVKLNKKFQEQKKVFGVQKNSLTSDSNNSDDSAASSKLGNTLAKQDDQLKLSDDDQAALPNPTAEYLVTQMPVVKKEVRPIYPAEAKKLGLSGKVYLDILISQQGKVVQAKVIKGIHPLLDVEALASIKKYQFSPAMVEKKAVAVKINYAINFILED